MKNSIFYHLSTDEFHFRILNLSGVKFPSLILAFPIIDAIYEAGEE